MSARLIVSETNGKIRLQVEFFSARTISKASLSTTRETLALEPNEAGLSINALTALYSRGLLVAQQKKGVPTK